MDCTMPDIGKIFALQDAAVRLAFKAVGLCKMHRNGASHYDVSNGVEELKAKNSFDNDHL